jgi:hypothetical protein
MLLSGQKLSTARNVIERRYTNSMPVCTLCQSSFEIQPDERAFLRKIFFRFGDTEIHPAEPLDCPDCRMLSRTCHRNERTFYKTKSAQSGKDMVSLYHEQSPFTVIMQEEWRGDDFEPMRYGRDFDFSRGFFDQFAELHTAVPRMNLITVSNENSPYTTGTGYCKNCYLINSSENCEDCYHGKLLQTCRDSMDCSYLYDSELCYGCFSTYKSYNCHYVLFSQNCQDCFFSSNLNGCKNCFLCTNLHQKEYHLRNEPFSKEEFKKKIAECQGSYEKMETLRKELLDIRSKQPQKYANIVNSENCTGDYIENSKNCIACFDVNKSEDCRFIQVGVEVKDNYDCSNMYLKIERCYQVLGTIEVFNCAYCIFVFHSQDLLYCDYCFHCSNCFGCSGLTRKKHCILNKQYSEKEYNELVPRIVEHMKNDGGGAAMKGAGASTEPVLSGIEGLSTGSTSSGSWGQFFPRKYAPFGYNESLAHEYVPLTKEDAIRKGFLWRDAIDQIPTVKKTIPAERLPDAITEIPDDVLNWAIVCERSKRPFQIITQELSYYRKHKLPLPHLHPDERHKDRMALRNPRKLYARQCGTCGKHVESTYAEDRPETILCEECYLKEVY